MATHVHESTGPTYPAGHPPVRDVNIELDYLAQEPSLNVYTQLSFIYAFPSSGSRKRIGDILTHGLAELTAAVPWVAGQVAKRPDANGRERYVIVQLDNVPRFIIDDISDDATAPTIAKLRDSHYSPSRLHESVLAPLTTIIPQDATELPVLLVQATVITGGLILTIQTHHRAMDMGGQSIIMQLLNRVCRGQSLEAGDVAGLLLDRPSIVPLMTEAELQQFDELALKEEERAITAAEAALDTGEIMEVRATAEPSPEDDGSPLVWAQLLFSGTATAEIKSEAMRTRGTAPFVSTNDAITALLWQVILCARVDLGLDTAEISTLSRATDMRSSIGAPSSYAGLLVRMITTSLPIGALVAAPLGRVAAALRGSLRLDFEAQDLRARSTRMYNGDTGQYMDEVDTTRDLLLSSWVDVPAYSLDFGLGLGKPEAVRRPAFTEIRGLLYIQPQRPDGEVAVLLCLGEAVHSRVKRDAAIQRWGLYSS